MAKKTVLVLALAGFLAGGVFAQNAKKNFIGGSVGLLDFGAHYERMLTPKFGIGAEAYFNSFVFFWNTIGFKAMGRIYPTKGLFFGLGLGLGFYTGDGDFEYSRNGTTVTVEDTLVGITGFLIEPEIGYKIDFGKPGGFYLEPTLGLPVVLGVQKATVFFNDVEGSFGVGMNPRLHLGLGFAF
ncbi:MAG: hypothetical protein LBD22_03125 [Spirochaetaceae bacterium]|jgi:hypothetical protein|nr:hypothetical protein [Spirochaetaceae bacterium]